MHLVCFLKNIVFGFFKQQPWAPGNLEILMWKYNFPINCRKITHLASLVLKISHLDPQLQKASYGSAKVKLKEYSKKIK